MTTQLDPDLDAFEQRVRDALDSLARSAIPDTPAASAQDLWPSRRTWSLVASVAALVAGVVGLAALAGRADESPAPPASQPSVVVDPIATTDALDPGPSDTSVQTSVPARPETGESAPDAAGGRPSDPVAILVPSPGGETGTTPGLIDRYLEQVATRRRAYTAAGATVVWSLWPDTEWDKTAVGEPTIELADGRDVVRIDHDAVEQVSYVIRTDDGVLAASFAGWAEEDFASWFTAASHGRFDDITPPLGFVLIPDPESYRIASWSSVTVTTSSFATPIDAAAYAAAEAPGWQIDSLGTLLLVRPSPSDAPSSVIWQPEPGVIVRLDGGDISDDELVALADDLVLTTAAESGLRETNLQLQPDDPQDEPTAQDAPVLGEAAGGRFAFWQAAFGSRTCRWFSHTDFGGTGHCTDSDPGPIRECFSGWAAPGRAYAIAFLQSGAYSSLEFLVDGEPVDPQIETDDDGALPWTLAWIRLDGYPNGETAPTITITTDGQPCG